jgi:uncharacterized protein (DUF2164 family)
MNRYFERIVTKNNLTHPRVAGLMLRNNLTVYNIRSRDEFEEEVYEVEISSKTFINYISNKIFDINYFYFQGIEEKTREMRRKIKVILKEYVYTRDEILALAISPSYPKEVSGIALSTSSEFDQELFDALCKTFQHPDPDVRFYAISSTSYTQGWQQLEQPLRAVVADDNDPEIKAIAEETLAALLKHDWNRSGVSAT